MSQAQEFKRGNDEKIQVLHICTFHPSVFKRSRVFHSHTYTAWNDMPHVNRGDTLSFKCDDGYFDLVVTGVRIFEGKGIKYVYLKPPFLRNKLFKGLVLQDTVPIGWNVY